MYIFVNKPRYLRYAVQCRKAGIYLKMEWVGLQINAHSWFSGRLCRVLPSTAVWLSLSTKPEGSEWTREELRVAPFSLGLYWDLPLLASQCRVVIDADRSVKPLPNTRGCKVLWAQETNELSTPSKGPLLQTAFDFLASRYNLHRGPSQMCVWGYILWESLKASQTWF